MNLIIHYCSQALHINHSIHHSSHHTTLLLSVYHSSIISYIESIASITSAFNRRVLQHSFYGEFGFNYIFHLYCNLICNNTYYSTGLTTQFSGYTFYKLFTSIPSGTQLNLTVHFDIFRHHDSILFDNIRKSASSCQP